MLSGRKASASGGQPLGALSWRALALGVAFLAVFLGLASLVVPPAALSGFVVSQERSVLLAESVELDGVVADSSALSVGGSGLALPVAGSSASLIVSFSGLPPDASGAVFHATVSFATPTPVAEPTAASTPELSATPESLVEPVAEPSVTPMPEPTPLPELNLSRQYKLFFESAPSVLVDVFVRSGGG